MFTVELLKSEQSVPTIMTDLSTEALANAICEELMSQGIDMQLCVEQCCDGASVMRGSVNSVQARKRDFHMQWNIYIHIATLTVFKLFIEAQTQSKI